MMGSTVDTRLTAMSLTAVDMSWITAETDLLAE